MDRISQAARSANMRQIASKGTKPELAVRRLVHGMGFRYRLHRHDLPGRPDLVFPGRRKVIFVHGCFWHQHAGCKRAHRPQSNLNYWVPKLQRNQERDVANRGRLGKLGWGVFVVWECEVGIAVDLADRIASFLNDD